MKEREYRAFRGLEIREEGGVKRLVGYAAVFDSNSVNLGGFVEAIRSGAFRRTLAAGADVRAMLEHDPGKIFARSTVAEGPGTLKVGEDDHGLRVEITPNDSQAGRDVIEHVRSGVLDAMSFGFYVAEGGERWNFKALPNLRELTDVDLDDVSVVSFPAYPKTEIALRSVETGRRCFEAARNAHAMAVAEIEARQRRLRMLGKGA